MRHTIKTQVMPTTKELDHVHRWPTGYNEEFSTHSTTFPSRAHA